MSGNQNSKIEPRTIALIGAASTALVIVNMSTGIEPPSQAVVVLQCIALAAALLTLVGGLIVMRRDRSDISR